MRLKRIRIFPKLAVFVATAMTLTAVPLTAFAAPGDVDCNKMLSIVDKVKPVDASLNEEENASLDGLLIEKGKATIVGLSDDAGENGFEIDKVTTDEKVARVVEELPEEAKNDPNYKDWQKQIRENKGAVILWGESTGNVKMDFNITNSSWKAACTHGHYRDAVVEVKAETVPVGTKTARVAEAVQVTRAAAAAAAAQLNASANAEAPSATLPNQTPSVPGATEQQPQAPAQTPGTDNGGASTNPSGDSNSGGSGNAGGNAGGNTGGSTGGSGGAGGNTGGSTGGSGSGSGGTEKPPVIYDSPTVLPDNPGSGSGTTGGSTGGTTGGSGSGSGDSEEPPVYLSPQFLPGSEEESESGTAPKAKTVALDVVEDDEAGQKNEVDKVDGDVTDTTTDEANTEGVQDTVMDVTDVVDGTVTDIPNTSENIVDDVTQADKTGQQAGLPEDNNLLDVTTPDSTPPQEVDVDDGVNDQPNDPDTSQNGLTDQSGIQTDANADVDTSNGTVDEEKSAGDTSGLQGETKTSDSASGADSSVSTDDDSASADDAA